MLDKLSYSCLNHEHPIQLDWGNRRSKMYWLDLLWETEEFDLFEVTDVQEWVSRGCGSVGPAIRHRVGMCGSMTVAVLPE